MFQRLPEWVDPDRALARGREISGFLPLSGMSRLAAELCDASGEASARFVFGRAEDGTGQVRGHVEALLRVQCQRCLEGMDLPVAQDFEVRLVADEAALNRVPGSQDAVCLQSRGLNLHELLEDELLLSLPIVALHPEGTACAASRPASERPVESRAERRGGDHPFAVLKSLKKDEGGRH